MQRRDFFRTAGAAAAGSMAGGAGEAMAAAPKKALMKAGTQHISDDVSLRFLAAFGVNHICSDLPSRKLDEAWSVEGLKRLKERVESYGISLDMVPIPLSSAYITRAEMPDIMLGRSPQRDKNIEDICQMIRNCAQAGIPAVKYNMSILGVVRTEATKGRGGATYSTFKFAAAKQEPALTEAGRVTDDIYWERITYFLDRVVPVANEYKIRIACHPHDPGMPKGTGYRGVNTVLGSVEGLKKFVSIRESPYHGLNFCQGTVSEMLEDPRKEIHDVIRHFGSRKKIFNVHFRNIEGKFLDFRETFPDNGDVDMLQAMRTYKEVGYEYMIMPDHVPKIEGDERGRAAFAYCFGYIQAAIQMVNSEG